METFNYSGSGEKQSITGFTIMIFHQWALAVIHAIINLLTHCIKSQEEVAWTRGCQFH